MIRITAYHDGFRRCGISHPAIATAYPNDRFTEEQLKALLGETQLNVELIEGDEVFMSSAMFQGARPAVPGADLVLKPLDELAAGGDPRVDDLLLQLDGLRTKLNLADEQLLQEKGKNETLLQEKEKLGSDLEEKTKTIDGLEAEKKTLADQVTDLQEQIAELKKPATTPKKEGKKQ